MNLVGSLVVLVGAAAILQPVQGYGTRAGTCRSGRSIGLDSSGLHGLDGDGGLGNGGFALQVDGVTLEERPSTANSIAIGPQTVRIGIVSIDGSTAFKGFLIRLSEKSGQNMEGTLTLVADFTGQILPSVLEGETEVQGPLSSCAFTATAYSHSERLLKTSTEVEFLTPSMTADLTLEVTVVVDNQGTGSDEWHYSEFDLAVTGDEGGDGGEVVDTLSPTASPSVTPTAVLVVDTLSPTSIPSVTPTAVLVVETPAPTTEGPTTTSPSSGGPSSIAPTTLVPTTLAPSPVGTTSVPSAGGTTAVPTSVAPTTPPPTVSPTSPSTTLLPTESGAPPVSSGTGATTSTPGQATTTDSPTVPPTFAPTLALTTAIPTPSVTMDDTLGDISLLLSLFTREPSTTPPTIQPSPIVVMTGLPTPADATSEPTPADVTREPTPADSTSEPSDLPTVLPTVAPTRDNIFRTRRPTRAPAPGGGETCADKSKPRFKVLVDYLARWSCRVIRQSDEWVKSWYCRQVKRAEKLCPIACNACRRREDNPDTGRPCRDKKKRWSLRVVESRGCSWLALQGDLRKRQLCRRTERMRTFCPVTCGTCDEVETSSSEEL